MSEMEQQPVYKIALGIEYDGSKYYGWQQRRSAQRAGEAGKGALAGGERTD
jgi:tRNA pseudouridine38-40 synthase